MTSLGLGSPLERSRELEALGAAIASAARGRGAAILIEGPPGIGKTTLLAEAAAAASDHLILTARADPLEQDLAFGIAGQLFEELLTTASEAERAELLDGAAALAAPVLEATSGAGPVNAQALWRGLYWLAWNLAATQPLVLVVDDLHWADLPSLHWLGYLTRRLDGMAVALLLGARRTEGERLAPIEAIAAADATETLAPQPLSPGAVRDLIAATIDQEPAPEFVDACSLATGGNPFLLSELLRDGERRGMSASAESAAELGGLAPESVIRSVQVRLQSLPPDAVELAWAAAVLGPDAQLGRAAELAGLGEPAAAAAADALASADLLTGTRDLHFVHPLVRTAVEESMPPSERRSRHGAAAHLLAGDGHGPEHTAPHLLLSNPAGSSEAVETLRAAAHAAAERGVPEVAVTYLERALEEPPTSDLRPRVLEELGTAAAGAIDPRAAEWLREACDEVTDPAARARCALALGRTLFFAGRPEEALDAIDQVDPELQPGERTVAARLEAELIAAARLDHNLRPRVAERLERLERLAEGDEVALALAAAQRSYELALAGEPSEIPIAMARRALGGGTLLAELGPEDSSLHTAINALALNECLDEALVAFDEVIEHARRRGSSLGFAISSCFRSQVNYRLGAVDAAEADARAAIEVAASEGWGLGIPAARAFLIDALLERGDVDAASHALAAAELGEEIPDIVMFDPLLASRGRVRVAAGRTEEGIADLLSCGERQERWGAHNPSVIPWRSEAAEAMARVGRDDEALALVTREVELARRTGLPRTIGMALRVEGVVRRDRAPIDEALALLVDGPSRTELPRARVSLGSLLRSDGQRSTAQDELRLALDEADRAGAGAVATAAREELLASGARPRRSRLSGREALTASELRVAKEAARGISNREIAQSLFVTVKTVEGHLSNAYSKLGIASRGELADAL